MIATSAAISHQMLKLILSETGSHISVMKKLPNFSHLAHKSTTSSISMLSMSHPLSRTTVPSTLSYDAFFSLPSSVGADLLVITPQRTNSPIRGNTKFAIYPIFTALNVVIFFVDGSIGSSNCLHLIPLSHAATMLATIASITYSHLQFLMPSMKSAQLTALNEK